MNLGVSLAQANNDVPSFIAMAAAALERAAAIDASYVESKNKELLRFMRYACSEIPIND